MSGNNQLTNRPEPKAFLSSVFMYNGTATRTVLLRVFVVSSYAAFVSLFVSFFPVFKLPITPFEYSEAFLGLILVLRVNAGQERWWEARKIWGSIVNQSRNLALIVRSYSQGQEENVQLLLKWIAVWPYVVRDALRGDRTILEVKNIIGTEEWSNIMTAHSMPLYVGLKISNLLSALRKDALDGFAFHRADIERAALIDSFGACERIRNTRMPFVLAIKTRRFIFLFLLLLPFALAARVGWWAPLVVALASYPLFSLDEIGAELQNPFSAKNLSHLPLNDICDNIAQNVLDLR